MSQTNFLIGRGELLTKEIKGPKRGGKTAEVYELSETLQRLRPQFAETAAAIEALPAPARPAGYAVAKLTLNPGYIAKSYFPQAVLRAVGLESVGSRRVKVTPAKWKKKGPPRESSTTQIFVAGKSEAFSHLSEWAEEQHPETPEGQQLSRIESFEAHEPSDRIKGYAGKRSAVYEVGIHLLPDEAEFIQRSFLGYADSLNVKVHESLALRAGGLWFIPIEGTQSQIDKIAEFSFVRVVRPMPALRGMRPMIRASNVALSCSLPSQRALSDLPRVAILDGGLPAQHTLAPWLNGYRKLDPSAPDDPDGLAHGLGVTSAFLFGPISPNGTASRPFAPVDHLRVLDKAMEKEDPLELYRTLGMVEQVLLSRQYEFINLSLGPDLCVVDDDVHAWTSVIDENLQDGNTFMTVAIGNNGERDREAGNARVQVPADCVNALAVGAATADIGQWERASYSAIGPGRTPGVIKPDLVAFGGSATSYFHALAPGVKPVLAPQLGTSFASPYLLRSAVGIRAVLGQEISPLAIKALLVHAADRGGFELGEVGWGKVPDELMPVISCGPGVARIIYQGELKPGKYLRAALPLPNGGLTGKIKLRATFCYASPVDPQDACSYTQAGLDVAFRPNSKRVKAGSQEATTDSFFVARPYATEEELRSDIGKWETVLHGEASKLGSSLVDPVFDIHYNAREGGGAARTARKIPYALVISIEAPKHANLYNDILQAYTNILTPIEPHVTVPVRV